MLESYPVQESAGFGADCQIVVGSPLRSVQTREKPLRATN